MVITKHAEDKIEADRLNIIHIIRDDQLLQLWNFDIFNARGKIDHPVVAAWNLSLMLRSHQPLPPGSIALLMIF